MRARPAQIALLLFSLVLAAGMAELMLRGLRPWLAMPEFRPFGFPSRELHHVYPRGARMHQPFGQDHYVMETNADGLRSHYERESFLEHPERVAILGDSFTFGSTVELAEAYPAVAEAALREAGHPELAILNAGIITYSPVLELALFRQIVRDYRPELTLLAVDVTDIGDDYHYARQRIRDPDGALRFDVEEREPRHPGYEHFALWNLAKPLRKSLRRLVPPAPPPRGRQARPIVIDGEAQRDRFFVLRFPLAKTRRYFDETLAHIRAVAREARTSGSRFALVVLPRGFHWDLAESPDSWEAARYGDFEAHRFEFLRYFEEAAARVDFPVIPLLPAFEASDERPLAFRNDPHWNPAGHRVAGRALAKALEAQGLLGATP